MNVRSRIVIAFKFMRVLPIFNLMRRTFIALWFGLCSLACSHYSIQQTSLVPPAIPSPIPASTVGPDFALLGSYVTRASDPNRLQDASLWVSRGIATGTFEYAFHPASIRVTGFTAPSTGAIRAQRDGFSNPARPVWGGGPGAVVRILRYNERHNLTFTGDLWLAIAPSRIDSRCIEDCNFASGGGARVDRSAAFMFNQGLQYRFRLLPEIGFTTSVTLQNLLRNDEIRERSALGGRSKIRMGAPHPMLDAGVELTPWPWVSVNPVVGWIAPPGALRYGASLSLVVRFHASR
jgi:hypothetical protein